LNQIPDQSPNPSARKLAVNVCHSPAKPSQVLVKMICRFGQ
jgi:hypothetical protein